MWNYTEYSWLNCMYNKLFFLYWFVRVPYTYQSRDCPLTSVVNFYSFVCFLVFHPYFLFNILVIVFILVTVLFCLYVHIQCTYIGLVTVLWPQLTIFTPVCIYIILFGTSSLLSSQFVYTCHYRHPLKINVVAVYIILLCSRLKASITLILIQS